MLRTCNALQMDRFRSKLVSFILSAIGNLAWANTLAYYGIRTLWIRNVFIVQGRCSWRCESIRVQFGELSTNRIVWRAQLLTACVFLLIAGSVWRCIIRKCSLHISGSFRCLVLRSHYHHSWRHANRLGNERQQISQPCKLMLWRRKITFNHSKGCNDIYDNETRHNDKKCYSVTGRFQNF